MTPRLLFSATCGELIQSLLLSWLDTPSLRSLDAAIIDGDDRAQRRSNRDLKLMWLNALKRAFNLPALEKFTYSESWIRWLISRGLGASSIDVKDASISDKTFQGISIPFLESIDLSGSKYITDAGIYNIVAGCPRLQTIRLFGCVKLTDASLAAIGEHYHGLRDFAIFESTLITDDGIAALTEGCPQLETILLDTRSKLTNGSLISIGQNCHELKEIDIGRFRSITDNGIAALTKGCCLLKSIHLIGQPGLSDATLAAVGQNCPELRDFSIGRYQDNITDEGLLALMEGCPHLEGLLINGIRHLPDIEVVDMMSD